MKEIEIHTFTEFHEVIAAYDERTIIYRGFKSVKYPLIPKIGRIVPPDSIGSREANEKEILRLFNEFLWKPRGTIHVKGKGEMDVGYAIGRRKAEPPTRGKVNTPGTIRLNEGS